MRLIAKSWLVIMALACGEPRVVASGPRVVSADEWRVVGRFAGSTAMAFGAAPDGTLFLSVNEGLYRALPGADSVWSRIATTSGPTEDFAITLYAASRRVLYGVTRDGRIFRWDEGHAWRALNTPASDSFWVERGSPRRFSISDVWGRGENDVFAAGERGVLHFDGDSWRFEPPLPFPAPADPRTFQRNIYSVGGDDSQVIVGGSSVFRKYEGKWSLLERPDELRPDCGVLAVAAWRGDVVVAGGDPGPCLARFANGRWTSFMPRVAGVRDNLFKGRAQSDGSMIFLSPFGEFVYVRGDSVAVYLLPALKGTRGAVASGPFLYFAGDIGDTATVVRITRTAIGGRP